MTNEFNEEFHKEQISENQQEQLDLFEIMNQLGLSEEHIKAIEEFLTQSIKNVEMDLIAGKKVQEYKYYREYKSNLIKYGKKVKHRCITRNKEPT